MTQIWDSTLRSDNYLTILYQCDKNFPNSTNQTEHKLMTLKSHSFLYTVLPKNLNYDQYFAWGFVSINKLTNKSHSWIDN